MKKLSILLILAVLTMGFGYGLSDQEERTVVETVIKCAYFNGAFNEMDTAAMKEGFHPDFAIFSVKGKELSKYPIADWIQAVEKRKKNLEPDVRRARMEGKIRHLDVTGNCASAKVELHRAGKRVYTDYLSLLKFEDGWKIVAKVYHAHQDR